MIFVSNITLDKGEKAETLAESSDKAASLRYWLDECTHCTISIGTESDNEYLVMKRPTGIAVAMANGHGFKVDSIAIGIDGELLLIRRGQVSRQSTPVAWFNVLSN